jgi:hypothetical protein
VSIVREAKVKAKRRALAIRNKGGVEVNSAGIGNPPIDRTRRKSSVEGK